MIIPSIIAQSQQEFDKRFGQIQNITQTVHIDVMDGDFVPQTSLEFDLDLPDTHSYEAHLMIKQPQRWIARHEIKTVLVHIEAAHNPQQLIEWVHEHDKQIGFAVNPETPVQSVIPYVEEVDRVLIMTVQPGKYGSPFLSQTLDKVRTLRERYPQLTIEVDGGMNPDHLRLASEAGADLFVSGSYILESKVPATALQQLKEAQR